MSIIYDWNQRDSGCAVQPFFSIERIKPPQITSKSSSNSLFLLLLLLLFFGRKPWLFRSWGERNKGDAREKGDCNIQSREDYSFSSSFINVIQMNPDEKQDLQFRKHYSNMALPNTLWRWTIFTGALRAIWESINGIAVKSKRVFNRPTQALVIIAANRSAFFHHCAARRIWDYSYKD